MEKINRAWYCLGDDDRKQRYVFKTCVRWSVPQLLSRMKTLH
jgi:hypothetical protein